MVHDNDDANQGTTNEHGGAARMRLLPTAGGLGIGVWLGVAIGIGMGDIPAGIGFGPCIGGGLAFAGARR